MQLCGIYLDYLIFPHYNKHMEIIIYLYIISMMMICQYRNEREIKMLCNQEIRTHAKNNNVRLYEVAETLKISEPTMTRKMRFELPQSEKERIFKIIDDIEKRKTAMCATAV